MQKYKNPPICSVGPAYCRVRDHDGPAPDKDEGVGNWAHFDDEMAHLCFSQSRVSVQLSKKQAEYFTTLKKKLNFAPIKTKQRSD